MSTPDVNDPGQLPTTPRTRRWIPVTTVVGGALVTGLLVGGTALAATDDTTTPSTSATATPDAPADGTATPPAPADGTATPPADGPRGGGPGGGPGGGGPGGGGPGAELADGATRAVGTVTAVDGSSLTVRTDAGDEVTVTLGEDTRYRTAEPTPPAEGETPTPPAEGSADDLAVDQRVEVTAKDGAALSVGVVRAHVGGTVVDASGESATVVTRDGLRVTLDLSATDDTVSVGEQVRATGTASADGGSVVVSSVSTATR